MFMERQIHNIAVSSLHLPVGHENLKIFTKMWTSSLMSIFVEDSGNVGFQKVEN